MKRLMILVGVIAVFTVSVFVYVKGTPQYSLYQFRRAVENHETDKALKYIDVESVVDKFIIDLSVSQDKKTIAYKYKIKGNDFANGLMTMMLPVMKETLKGQYQTVITTPSDYKSPVKDNEKGLFSQFNIKSEGKMAILSQKDNKDVKIKMVKTTEGNWKIVQLMNPDSMIGLQ